jgi:hypothetical protein
MTTDLKTVKCHRCGQMTSAYYCECGADLRETFGALAPPPPPVREVPTPPRPRAPVSFTPPAPSPEDLYVEYRRWRLWWGLFIDSQQDFNELLREYNGRGYEVVAFHHHNGLIPNVTLFRWILILAVQMLTFGFVAYYVGPSFVFRRRP